MNKAYDPDKPLYQWTGYPPPFNMWIGGKCSEVTVKIDFDDQKEAMRLRDMQRGSDMMLWGAGVAVVCFVVHACTSYKPLRQIAEWGIVGGVLSIVIGIIFKKMTEYENLMFALLALIVVGAGIFLYRKRDSSISHFFRKKKAVSDG
jgi:uncharacterized membrane protein